MKEQTLTTILVKELKATVEDGHHKLPEGTRITVFLTTGAAAVRVGKITGVRLTSDFAALDSEDGRFYTDVADISGIRVDEEAESKREIGLGFRG